MDDEQWGEVQARITSYFPLRPRPYDEWFRIQKKCFLEVWGIIFPKRQYPTFHEPLSPFHLDSSSLADLSSRIDILLRALYEAKARQAISNSSTAAMKYIHLPDEQQMRMMRDTIANAINMSPSASYWLANVPLEGLQAAVADYDQVNPLAKEVKADTEPVNLLEQALYPGSGLSMSDEQITLATRTSIPPSTWRTEIPLCPWGTIIYLKVSPSYDTSPHPPPEVLQINHPPSFDIQRMEVNNLSPLPLAVAPVSAAESGPGHQSTDQFMGAYTTLLEVSEERMD
ncbi:hypothetical protein F5Y13DRAFT_202516 [Hypoxylon sp. FL1857]|nr:hypothetical protein F5Y13DRAFT_202516 [Hypoxylon sp. FL1857]